MASASICTSKQVVMHYAEMSCLVYGNHPLDNDPQLARAIRRFCTAQEKSTAGPIQGTVCLDTAQAEATTHHVHSIARLYLRNIHNGLQKYPQTSTQFLFKHSKPSKFQDLDPLFHCPDSYPLCQCFRCNTSWYIADLLVGQLMHFWPQRCHTIHTPTPFLIAMSSCWLQIAIPSCTLFGHSLLRMSALGSSWLQVALPTKPQAHCAAFSAWLPLPRRTWSALFSSHERVQRCHGFNFKTQNLTLQSTPMQRIVLRRWHGLLYTFSYPFHPTALRHQKASYTQDCQRFCKQHKTCDNDFNTVLTRTTLHY